MAKSVEYSVHDQYWLERIGTHLQLGETVSAEGRGWTVRRSSGEIVTEHRNAELVICDLKDRPGIN